MKSRIRGYLAIAFGWSWLFWIGAYFAGRVGGIKLQLDLTLLDLLGQMTSGTFSGYQIAFALAVFGPALGFLLYRKSTESLRQRLEGHAYPWQQKKNWIALIVAIPAFVVLPTALVSLLTLKPALNGGPLLVAIGLYFISNLLTSGTEELGWRGVLYPLLKAEGGTFWQISLKSGLIWALWHFPMLFVFYEGLPIYALAPMLVGFTASIVAMNYITNFLYEKTGFLPLMMGLHALNNTLSFAITAMFPGNPYMLLINALPWAVVGWIEHRYKPQ